MLVPKAEQFRTERKQFSRLIPDPLEEIIEGENRLERYVHFMGMLEKIWWFQPDRKAQNQPSSYSRYLWGARINNEEEISFNMVPDAIDLTDLNAESFETLIPFLGPDYIRVRFVTPNILDRIQNGEKIMPGGGSCVAESGDHTVINLIKDYFGDFDKELIPWFAKEVIKRNPTMTQISGASLGGQDKMIFLIESNMFTDKFKEWGIPRQEAEKLVLAAYNETLEAFKRRSELINNQSRVVPLNFDALNLKIRVDNWLSTFGTKWDERLRVFEVLFTYIGDTMKEAIQEVLQDNSISLWARLKQDDHWIAEENSEVPTREIQKPIEAEIILPRRMEGASDEKLTVEKQLQRKNYITLIKMLRWVFQQKKSKGELPGIGSIGFADLPGPHGSVAHQYADWGGPVNELFKRSHGTIETTKVILLEYLDSEQRLHRLNFSSHFAYLKRFFSLPTENNEGEINSVRESLSLISAQIKDRLMNVEEKDNLVSEREKLKNRLKELQKEELNPFPLQENPFIHHAMQFLWDPDFCLFIKHAIEIEAGIKEKQIAKDQGKAMIKKLMEKIFPKLQAYYGYFYDITDLKESALSLRNTRVLD